VSIDFSFVREGALGGWRRHFPPEAEAAFGESGYEEAMVLLPRNEQGEHHANTF